jgi:hypothetical protein
MRERRKDPALDREDLRDDEPSPNDDIETAEAKSGSIDERAPEPSAAATARGLEAPAPAVGLPQGGVAVPRGEEDPGPGEQVLEKEREHLRLPRRPG